MKKPLAVALLALVPLAVYAGADASNHKKENNLGANYWNAQAAIDGKMDTAWMVPGESVNLGEWIRLDLPKGNLDKIGVVNGWAKDEESYTDYARVKKMLVEVWCCAGDAEMKSTGTAHVEFEDNKRGMQVIDIDDIMVGNGTFGGKVKLSVVEVYDGQDFPNLAVSEILIHMEESLDAIPELDSLMGEEDDPNLLLMLDFDKGTAWKADVKKAHFRVSGNGYGLSTLYIEHGGKDFARAKKVQLTVGNRSAVHEVPDTKGPHALAVPAVFGYTGSATDDITVEVLEVYGTQAKVAISELTAKATNFDELSAF